MIKIEIEGSSDIRVLVDGEPREAYVFNGIVTFPLERGCKIELECQGKTKVVDMVVNNIRFGLVTFLCTTVNGTQNTEVNQGTIQINLDNPTWRFWCEKMNNFNYEDYPLGSTN